MLCVCKTFTFFTFTGALYVSVILRTQNFLARKREAWEDL
jgi:hypothetical protein